MWTRSSDLGPIVPEKPRIRNDDVDASSQINLEGFLSTVGEIGLVTRSRNDVCQDDAIRLIVFDDEYTCHEPVPYFRPLGEAFRSRLPGTLLINDATEIPLQASVVFTLLLGSWRVIVWPLCPHTCADRRSE